MKIKTDDVLTGTIVGFIGGAIGLYLSYTIDETKVSWFLLPVSVVIGMLAYIRGVKNLK